MCSPSGDIATRVTERSRAASSIVKGSAAEATKAVERTAARTSNRTTWRRNSRGMVDSPESGLRITRAYCSASDGGDNATGMQVGSSSQRQSPS